MEKINTFIIPIIRSDFLPKMLETLYKYTELGTFDVIVIDNSVEGLDSSLFRNKVHLWVRPYRNLGFSKSMNLGIKLAQTKYVTLANDDIEFLDTRWWQGIIDTFHTDPRIVAVNPMSPKEASWGYGLTVGNLDTWQAPNGFAPLDSTKEGIVPIIENAPWKYEGICTPERYDQLLTKHPTWSKDSCCDAIAMWCTVFRREDLINPTRLGLLDEKFYPGGGEDYDMNARAYSCAWPYERDECDPDYHWRMVGSSRSWVWHHWGKSRDISARTPQAEIFKGRERWNNNDELWPNGFDVWGHKEVDGKRIPLKRIPKIFIDNF